MSERMRSRLNKCLLVLGLAGGFACSGGEEACRRGCQDGRSAGVGIDEEVINRFHQMFYARRGLTWMANRWLGVQTGRIPLMS